MASPIRVYWDSCAWLGLINGEATRKPDLDAVYGLAKRGVLELWTSTIAIVEVNRLQTEMNIPRPITTDGLNTIDNILFQPFVKLVGMDVMVAKKARDFLRTVPGLTKRPDAMHLATAAFWNIPLLHTYDDNDLLHLNGKVMCEDGTVMQITIPSDPTAGGLLANLNA